MNKNYYLGILGLEGEDAMLAQIIINRLHALPRTGWVDRGVKNPETVGEHTDQTVLIAKKYFAFRGLKKMLIIHDWAESDKAVGDIRTDVNCPKKSRCSKEEKYRRELRAMENICSGFKSGGEEILKLWLEFEERKTLRARVGGQIDKFQMIKKAYSYQKTGQPISAEEFYIHSGPEISNVVLRHALDKIKLTLK
ncbi:MAG: HD domain-containing protein [Candidatus Falkowbacteria bacterium]|nr:HD domain-containing protein [Candidatus Falkowbacteria bacterium]